MHFGERLRALIAATRLQKKEVADKAGVSDDTLYRMLRAESAEGFNSTTIRAVAGAIGVSELTLVSDDPATVSPEMIEEVVRFARAIGSTPDGLIRSWIDAHEAGHASTSHPASDASSDSTDVAGRIEPVVSDPRIRRGTDPTAFGQLRGAASRSPAADDAVRRKKGK